MPRFINTTGHANLGIGICDRCKKKTPLDTLVSDPNSPGLMVHSEGCVDEYDPWRLPPRETEGVDLPFYRPDTPIPAEEGASPTSKLNIINGLHFWTVDDVS